MKVPSDGLPAIGGTLAVGASSRGRFAPSERGLIADFFLTKLLLV